MYGENLIKSHQSREMHRGIERRTSVMDELVALAEEARELWVPREVARRDVALMTSLEFLRDYVQQVCHIPAPVIHCIDPLCSWARQAQDEYNPVDVAIYSTAIPLPLTTLVWVESTRCVHRSHERRQ